MDSRDTYRFPVECPVTFSGESCDGVGTVTNLSKRGWKVNSNWTVSPGTYLALWVSPPDYEWPMKVNLAVVRWSRGQEFGLEIMDMRPEEQERHQRFVSILEMILETLPQSS